jgi:hypothetical protein
MWPLMALKYAKNRLTTVQSQQYQISAATHPFSKHPSKATVWCASGKQN